MGDQKIDLESKNFLKQPATDLEKEYALKDAALTLRLGLTLDRCGIMRGARILTIGSRTMKDWNDWLALCKVSFDEWAFGTEADCEVQEIKEQYELHLRTDYRGGRCQAFKHGMFKD